MKAAGKALILDANILIRLVLGTRVRALVLEHLEDVEFFSPQECFDDARRYLPNLLNHRGVDPTIEMHVLDQFEGLIHPLAENTHFAAYDESMARIGNRMPATGPSLLRLSHSDARFGLKIKISLGRVFRPGQRIA